MGKRDHATISFNFKYSSSATVKERLVPRYYKGNYDGMREYLREINWEAVLKTGNIQDSWQRFENIMLEATNNFVPKSVIRPNKNSEWPNTEIKKSIDQKDKCWKVYKLNQWQIGSDMQPRETRPHGK